MFTNKKLQKMFVGELDAVIHELDSTSRQLRDHDFFVLSEVHIHRLQHILHRLKGGAKFIERTDIADFLGEIESQLSAKTKTIEPGTSNSPKIDREFLARISDFLREKLDEVT
ncbi:MAG: Hpt domain-containing protein [bacterium]|nr:Hpt domain-containing protein [bacterium]